VSPSDFATSTILFSIPVFRYSKEKSNVIEANISEQSRKISVYNLGARESFSAIPLVSVGDLCEITPTLYCLYTFETLIPVPFARRKCTQS